MDAPAVDRLVQRQGLGLGGVVGGVVDGIGGVVDGVGSVVSSVVGGVTSAVGGLGGALTASQTSATSSSSLALSTSSTSSRILPSTSSTSARSSSSTISSSSSSSSFSSSSASSSVLSSSTFSSTSRSSSSSALSTPTALPPTTTAPPLVIETVTSNGVPRTVIVSQAVDAPVETNPVAPAAPKGFLENKGLSGFVFALCGLVGLVLIIAIVTFIIRRKRSKALMNEAIDFDPSAATTYRDDMERALSSEKRNSSSSSAGSYRGNGSQISHGSHNQQPMVPQGPTAYYDTGYAQPMNYHPQQGYAEYPTYAPPNPAYGVGRPAQHYTDAGQNNAAYNIAYETRGQSPSPPPRTQAPATALPDTFGDSYNEKSSVMETANGAPLKVANHQAY